MSRTSTFTVWLLLVAATTTGTTGCWSRKSTDWKMADAFSLKKGMPWHEDEEAMRQGVPVRMACTWIDTVRHQQGERPQRGFGGRILFYDREGNDPIKVDGALVVYAFDETDRDVLDNRPTRRYVFPPEQVEMHMSRSSVGPSYSFFLPWDEAGGPQTEISLICRFQPRTGGVVISEQTRHMLPGEIPAGNALAGKPSHGRREIDSQPMYQRMVYESQGGPRPNVQQASFEAAAEAAAARRMTTTSISLPDNFRLPAKPKQRAGAAEPASLPQAHPQRPVPAQTTLPAEESAAAAVRGAPPSRPSHGRPGGRQPFVPIGKAQLGGPMASPFSSPATRPTPWQQAHPAATTAPSPHDHPAAATMPPHPQPAIGQHWSAEQAMSGPAPPMNTAPPQSFGGSTDGGMTTVSYLSPEESLRWERGQRSFDSTPMLPQAPSPPAAQ